jgi:hypothetical protein
MTIYPLASLVAKPSSTKSNSQLSNQQLEIFANDSDAPINGTGNGESATNDPRLLQDHRERRRHELAAPLAYPWRERAKAAGG